MVYELNLIRQRLIVCEQFFSRTQLQYYANVMCTVYDLTNTGETGSLLPEPFCTGRISVLSSSHRGNGGGRIIKIIPVCFPFVRPGMTPP